MTARLQREMRTNHYDPATGDLVLSAVRAAAFDELSDYYADLFMDDPALADLRDAYAMNP